MNLKCSAKYILYVSIHLLVSEWISMYQSHVVLCLHNRCWTIYEYVDRMGYRNRPFCALHLSNRPSKLPPLSHSKDKCSPSPHLFTKFVVAGMTTYTYIPTYTNNNISIGFVALLVTQDDPIPNVPTSSPSLIACMFHVCSSLATFLHSLAAWAILNNYKPPSDNRPCRHNLACVGSD